MNSGQEPVVEVRNAQRSVKISREQLQSFGQKACVLAWGNKRPGSCIASLKLVSVTIVGDRRMATLHRQFCGIPETTDVLTFQYGEIVISAETAARQARQFHSTTERELQLYLLHGLLHLCGFDDGSPKSRHAMHKLQHKLMCAAMAREKKRPPMRQRLNVQSSVVV